MSHILKQLPLSFLAILFFIGDLSGQSSCLSGNDTIIGPSVVCYSDSTVTFGAPGSSGFSYQWVPPAGNWGIFGSDTTNVFTFFFDPFDTVMNVHLLVSGPGCATSSLTHQVEIEQFSGPPPPLFGPESVCQGDTLVFETNPHPNNYLNNWTVSSEFSVIGNLGEYVVVVPISGGIGTVSFDRINTCGMDEDSQVKNVSIYSNPSSQYSVIGPDTVCPNNYYIFMADLFLGDSVNTFEWNFPSGMNFYSMVGTSGVQVFVDSAFSGGLVRVFPVNECGPGNSSIAHSVTVGGSGSIINSIGLINVCPESVNIYQVPLPNPSGSYYWSASPGIFLYDSVGISVTAEFLPGFSGGFIGVYEKQECGNGPVNEFFISPTIPSGISGALLGPDTICPNADSISIFVQNYNGNNSISWINSPSLSLFSQSGEKATFQVNPGFSSGWVVASLIDSCGNHSFSDSLHLYSSPGITLPNPILGTSSICFPTSNFILNSPSSGEIGVSYNWTVPGGLTIFGDPNSPTISVVSDPSFMGGLVSLSLENDCGLISSSITHNINAVLPLDSAGPISGPDSLCFGDTIIQYSITPLPGAIGYQWDYPIGLTAISGDDTPSITFIVDSLFAGGSITVAGYDSCGSGPLSPPFYVHPSSSPNPPLVSGPQIVGCIGDTVIFQITTTMSGESYSWNIPNGLVPFGQTNTSEIYLVIDSLFQTTQISANSQNSCGLNITGIELTITQNILPPQSTFGFFQDSICNNVSHHTISLTSTSGAQGFQWSYSLGVTGPSTTSGPTVQIQPTGTQGPAYVVVSPFNNCGNGYEDTLFFDLVSSPAQAGTIYGDSTICDGPGTTIYSVPIIPGANYYNWILNGDIMLVSQNQNQIEIAPIPGGLNGTIKVEGKNSCGEGQSSQFFYIDILPAPPTPNLTQGPTSVCSGTAHSFACDSLSGVETWNWMIPNGAYIDQGAGTNEISVFFPSGNTGGLIYANTQNSCGTSFFSDSIMVNVSDLPPSPISVIGPSSVCLGTSGVPFETPLVPGADYYIWESPNGSFITSAIDSNQIEMNFPFDFGTGMMSVFSHNQCGMSSLPASSAIEIVTVPNPVGNIAGPSSICEGVGQLTLACPVNPNTDYYNWNVSQGVNVLGGDSTTFLDIEILPGTNSVTISVNGANVCGLSPPSAPLVITLNPLPENPTILSGDEAICIGETELDYSCSIIQNAIGYTWGLPPQSTMVFNGGNDILVSFDSNPQSGWLTVFGINSCGSSPEPDSMWIEVSSVPQTPIITMLPPDSLTSISIAESYSWVENGNPSGNGTQSIVGVPGMEYVLTIVENGCSSSPSDPFVFPLVSIDQDFFSDNISIYPNPATSKLNIKIVDGKIPSPLNIRLYNQVGQLVKVELENDFFQNIMTLDLGSLPTGIYHLAISDEYHEVSKKIVIRK